MEMQRDGMIEMLGDMEVHYMSMSPHEVQARWTMWTSSSTEGAGALFA